MKSAIVLGAGMVGVSTALALRDRGWNVTLVDRKAPGQETSFGNAGIIQAEAVEPYAMPRTLRELFNIVTGRSNDVHYSLQELPFHVRALMRYWWHSKPSRHLRIAQSWASLIRRSTEAHQPLIERAGADNLVRRSGWRVLYRNQADLEAGIVEAERIRATYGVPFLIRSPQETLQDEPALTNAGFGSIHWTDSWTASNPGALVEAYGELFTRGGGHFAYGKAESLEREGAGWSVETDNGKVTAEEAVVCLGPWSSDLLKPFGHSFLMVRKRGYHAHYRSPLPLQAPVFDTANGYVMAPMAAGTRITTGAHVARFDAAPAYSQLERAESAAKQLIDLGARVEDKPWHGTRPCMPDMLPVIGASHYQKGLWMNFGHGHQGFTLGPVSAALLAAMMDGATPDIDMKPFRPERY
jgi:D-amino-acid dehydrogenase